MTDTALPKGGAGTDKPRRSFRRIKIALLMAFLVAIGIAWYVLQLTLVEMVWIAGGLGLLVFGYFYGYRRFVTRCISTFGFGFNIFLWAWPLILLGIGYYVPEMHDHVQFPMQNHAKDWVLILGSAGTATALISAVSSFVMVREEMIIVNLLFSVLWLCVITWCAATVRMESNGIEYWTLIAMIASVVEVIVGGIGSIHNAWNKNPTQIQSTGSRVSI